MGGVVVRKERTVRVDFELWHTSECLLLAGQEQELGSGHQFRASLVFTAFALEAYLNHIGQDVYACWEQIEPKLGPEQKLSLLCEKLAIKQDWSCQPWQTIRTLCRFRNSIAHGRGQELNEESSVPVQHFRPGASFFEMPLCEWEKFVTAESAVRAREDVLKICELLASKSGKDKHSPFFPGAISGSASVA